MLVTNPAKASNYGIWPAGIAMHVDAQESSGSQWQYCSEKLLGKVQHEYAKGVLFVLLSDHTWFKSY